MEIDNRVAKVLELFEPIESEQIRTAFDLRLKQMQVKDVFVNDVDVDIDGNISVEFTDDDGDIDVLFTLDPDEGPIAFIEPDDDDSDFIIVDLSDNNVPIIKTEFGDYLDLINLSWLNKDTLRMILGALDVEDLEEVPFAENVSDEINELTKVVVRGGKKTRIALVRRKRKKRLTGAQRQGIMRAKVKRRAKLSQTNRKRKKSMLLRKRSHLKTGGTPRNMKVRGTK